MFETFQICPYTGLRSFTEEESLYFKGREEHIEQATQQLQRNKFLMLTGASGDGKSSLVYAGIVPNARAGFLKSKYTQWQVADFRPERTPFKNLCKSLGRSLNINNPDTVAAELQHGFSALADLYKNSDCYLDLQSVSWMQANETQQAALKRKAANLMIIVDQFEEFFTNPENYHQGVPSGDSNLVLNLLLETARIALEEDLPIYVVFTMRSDYIGQCAAFRSLPEYLGFSQFFVPRLNRLQLQQVIEEPASLSGNRISRRLTERLIHDIAEGVDQLPILQHALNQIWHAADSGNEEMDLIHYAMVSGMPAGELPDDQVDRFKSWFEQLPEEIKKCYHRPDLQNVLDTHANKLYESAEEYYLKKTGRYISDEVSKSIIRTAFSCLTKIDQSRAVRNRMTLREIHQIMGQKELEMDTIGQVINIFREPGNTFIRPFISGDPESLKLAPDDVLDITHESLIRNWDLLKAWAKEEHNSYLVSQDFEQQLGRWVESGKSDSFLLSIGPLTYFENWYLRVKPNSWWIARYLPETNDEGNKLKKAELVLNNSTEFIQASARKHLITRTVMRLGGRRIATVLAGLLLFILAVYGVVTYSQRQNVSVLRKIKNESLTLANSSKLNLEFPVPGIIQQLQLGNLTIPEALGSINDSIQRIRLAIGIADLLILQGKQEPVFEINQIVAVTDSLLNLIGRSPDPDQWSSKLKLHNDFRLAVGHASMFNSDPRFDTIAIRNASRSWLMVKHILINQPEAFTDVQNLNLALENAIHYNVLNREEIDELIAILSPFENAERSPWIQKMFSRDKLLPRGGLDYTINFNGLFQELAYLYASQGNSKKALWCIDSLLVYNQNYYQNDYETTQDNATNISGVFYTSGFGDSLDQFVTGYSLRKKISKPEFYNRVISRILTDNGSTDNFNFYGVTGVAFSNFNLHWADEKMVRFLFDKLKAASSLLNDPDARNLTLALAYKNEGSMLSLLHDYRGDTSLHPEIDSLFWMSYNHYQKVSIPFLNQSTSTINFTASDVLIVPKKYLYLFPDYHVPFHPFEPRKWVFFYTSAAFTEFVLNHGLLKTVYQNKDDLKVFETWMLHYHGVSVSRDYMMREAIPHSTLVKLANQLDNTGLSETMDLNLLYLHLGNNCFQRNEKAAGLSYYDRLQPGKVLNGFQYKGFNFINDYTLEQYGIAISHLLEEGHTSKSHELVRVFKEEVNRSSLYGFAAQKMLWKNKNQALALSLIDSAKVELQRIKNLAVFQPNRHQIAIALMLLDDKKHEAEAQKIIKNSINKIESLNEFGEIQAYRGNLYKAYQGIPALISDEDQGYFYFRILFGYSKSFEPGPPWKKFEENVIFYNRFYLPYINENN